MKKMNNNDIRTRRDEIDVIQMVMGKRMVGFANRLSYFSECSRFFDPEDVVQETFMRLLTTNPERELLFGNELLEDGSLEVRIPVSTYVFLTEKRVFFNMMKKYKYHMDDVVTDEIEAIVEDPGSDPLSIAINNELSEVLSDALGKLKPEERELIEELFLTDNVMRESELAEQRGLTLNTYSMRRNRILKRLKGMKELKEYYELYLCDSSRRFNAGGCMTSKSYGAKND